MSSHSSSTSTRAILSPTPEQQRKLNNTTMTSTNENTANGNTTMTMATTPRMMIMRSPVLSPPTMQNGTLTSHHTLNLNQQLNQSVLFVNVKELNLKLYNEIIISWNILEQTSMNDWIGVYRPTCVDLEEYIEIQRVNGAKIGHITWSLNKLKSMQFRTHHHNNNNNHSTIGDEKKDQDQEKETILVKQLNNTSNNRLEQDDQLEFRYCSGIKLNTSYASSISLKVILAAVSNNNNNNKTTISTAISSPNSLLSPSISLAKNMPFNDDEFVTFRISDIKGAQLRKGMFFNPDPYVKITIIANVVPSSSTSTSINSTAILYGYAREYKTFAATNTCFPNWKNENFVIVARETDRILFEVKDKFARTKPSINRFLGRILVDINQLMEKAKANKGKYHFTFNLTKRTNNDNVTGSFSFVFSTFTGNRHQNGNSNSTHPLNNTIHQSLIASPSTPLAPNHSFTGSLDSNHSSVSDQQSAPRTNDSSSSCQTPVSVSHAQNKPSQQSRPVFSLNECSVDSPASSEPTSSTTCKVETNSGDTIATKASSYLSDCSSSSSSSSSSASASSSSGSSDETAVNEDLDANTNRPCSSSNKQQQHDQIECEEEIIHLSSSSSSQTSSKITSRSNSMSNSTELTVLVVPAAQNPASTTTTTTTTTTTPPARLVPKRFYSHRSKSLEHIKQTRYQQNQASLVFKSNPCSLNSTNKIASSTLARTVRPMKFTNPTTNNNNNDCNKSATTRTKLYLKRNEQQQLMELIRNLQKQCKSKSENDIVESSHAYSCANNENSNMPNSTSDSRLPTRLYVKSTIAKPTSPPPLPPLPSSSQLINTKANILKDQIAIKNELNQTSETSIETTTTTSTTSQNHVPNESNTKENLVELNKNDEENVLKTKCACTIDENISNTVDVKISEANTSANIETVNAVSSQQEEERLGAKQPHHEMIEQLSYITNQNSNFFAAAAPGSSTCEDLASSPTQIHLPADGTRQTNSPTEIEKILVSDELNVTVIDKQFNCLKSPLQEDTTHSQLISIANDVNAVTNDEPSSPPSSSSPSSSSSSSSSKKSKLNNTDMMIPASPPTSTYATATNVNVDQLPAYWEARVDHLGRVFYIDHKNRTTTWKKPKANANQELAHQHTELEKQRLDKRYQSIRRTINPNNHDTSVVYSNKAKILHNQPSSSSHETTHQSPANNNDEFTLTTTPTASTANSSSNDQLLLLQPGVQFILRPDLHSLVKKNQEAKDLVKQSTFLIGVLQKIRTNPLVYYKRYQHNKELVKFLNMFSNPNDPLPAGWDIKYVKNNKNNKIFFVDHNSRSTTFIDPRLPLLPSASGSGSASPSVSISQFSTSSNNPPHITTITTITPPSTLNRNAADKSTRSSSKLTPESSSQLTPKSLQPPVFPPPPPPPPPTTPPPLPPPSAHSPGAAAAATPPPPPQSLPPSIQKTPGEQTITSSTLINVSPVSPTVSHTTTSIASATTATASSSNLLTPTSTAPVQQQQQSQQQSQPTTSQPQAQSRPVNASKLGTSAPIAYSDRVVIFLQQPNLFDILKRHNIQLTTKQKDKLNLIRQNGRSVYDRMCADLDLASVVSQLEDLIMCHVIVNSSTTNANNQPATNNTSTDLAQTNNASETTTTAVNGAVAGPSQQSSSQQQHQHQPAKVSNNPVPKYNNNNRRDYQRNFQTKLRNFYRKLESKGYGQGPQKSKIVIRRDLLLSDAKAKFMQLNKHDLRRNKLFICFQGEEGLDYGGPAREFFYLLSRELFNPYYGLFEYSASDMYTVQISSMSTFQDHVLEWFQFAGRVIGVALIHQYLLDAFFTRPFYKALLRDTNWTLSDLETLDPEFCKSLVWVKEHDVTLHDFTFSVTENKCGQVIERDLKENGRNVAVTEKNKMEYIQRMIKWRVERDVQKQTEALVKGFYEVVDPKHVQIFDARELELVLCGTIEIDLNDWKKNTDYRSGYHSNHPIIVWFWQAVDKFDNDQKLKLLQFVTGTSSIPHEGFSALRGSNGPRKFCIERWGTVDALPRAHTCFNRLDLPPYTSYEILYEKLLLAIEETSGFCIQ